MNKAITSSALLVLTLSFAAVAPSFACTKCPEAASSTKRAIVLEKRNTFLNTKFAQSDSAPRFHHEKARAARIACKKA